MFSFLKYALLSVVRNRMRTFHAMVGIALALSMISGSFIAVDSSSAGMLQSALDNVSVDFVCRKNILWDVSAIAKVDKTIGAIKSVKYVTNSTPAIINYGLDMRNPAMNLTYSSPYGGSEMVMIPTETDGFFDHFRIAGEVPEPGTVAISKYMADFLQLDVGDTLQCQSVDIVDNPKTEVRTIFYCNFTFIVSQIWAQSFPSIQNQFSSGSMNPADNVVIYDILNPVIVNLEDAETVLNQLAEYGRLVIPSRLVYYVWVDRDEVITIADIPLTLERLDYIHNRLMVAVQNSYLAVMDSDLIRPLQVLDPQLSLLKVFSLVLSIPVITLGIYLSLVGIDLGMTGRRREVGILKSKGASSHQIFSHLMLESLIIGVIASAVGLLLGIFVSRFLMSTATTFGAADLSADVTVSLTDIDISISTIALSMLLGIILMLMSTYVPFKRISRMPVSKTLHHYSQVSTMRSYVPSFDIALIGLSVFSVVSTMLGTDAAHGQGLSWIAELIISFLLLMGIVMFPIMPFFLSIGVVRLMTMGSHRLYARLTALVKPWTKELTYLVNKNITRNPRRASNLGVIISLAIAFGIFISVTMESTFAQEQESVKFEVGSDIKIVGTQSSRLAWVDYENIAAVDLLPGVESVSHFIEMPTTSLLGNYRVAAINSSKYLEVVRPGDFYFVGHGNDVLGSLEEKGTCLVTKGLVDRYDILEGDEITFQYMDVSLELRIIGVVKALPGLTRSSIFIDSGTMGFAPFGQVAASGASIGAFLRILPGADPNEVAMSAVTTFAEANINATAMVYQDELNALHREPTYRALSDFLGTQYALSLIIMSVGVGLLIFVAVSDREHELACILARGASKSQMRRMLMGESISLMSLGLIVGTSIGFLTAYLFNTLWENETTVVERSMVFSTISGIVLILSIASLLIASLVATSRAGKVRLTEILRIRGG